MAADGEAGGSEIVDGRQAAFELVHAATSLALKVVVMRFARALVEHGAAGQVDRREPGFGDQGADRPVHGGDAKTADVTLSEVQGFERRQRPMSAVEGGADGVELSGVAGARGRHLPTRIRGGHVFAAWTDRFVRDEFMAYDVLIVDDSTAVRKILQRMLRQTNVPLGSILEAGDGLEALTVLKAKPVNLVLSDIAMPKMDGLQLLRAVRASALWNRIPVIMIATEGNESKVMEAVQLGANGYVRKPFTTEQLKTRLDALR